MDWVETQLLEVFRVVARYGSITAAAQTLRFTQSAVSRQIATLEAELGARVFDRLPRGVALTEEGRALLPHAEAVLDRFATARRELDQLRTLQTMSEIATEKNSTIIFPAQFMTNVREALSVVTKDSEAK